MKYLEDIEFFANFATINPENKKPTILIKPKPKCRIIYYGKRD